MATASTPPPESEPDPKKAKKGKQSRPVKVVKAVPDGAKQPRVAIANRADGGVIYWLAKLYGFAAIVFVLFVALAMILSYRAISVASPPAPDFRTYASAAPSVSRIYAADGTLLGEFAREWRTVTPYEKIPKPMVNAFLAVEDHDF